MACNRERKEMTMNMIKKLFILAVVTVALSLSLANCGKKTEKPAVEESAKETKPNEHPTDEHPTNEHPTNEHPTNEHPTDE